MQLFPHQKQASPSVICVTDGTALRVVANVMASREISRRRKEEIIRTLLTRPITENDRDYVEQFLADNFKTS